MGILSSEELASFKKNGYVVVPSAAPAALVEAAIDAIWQFQQMDPNDPTTWYRKPERENGLPELNGAGMVELYHHPAFWAIRQLPRIHGVFADLWGTEKLWVSIDRCNFNVPNRSGFDFEGFIHWDIDTSLRPLPFGLQGFLSLTDSVVGQGGFQCVPGMSTRLAEWAQTQPAARNPFRPDLTGLDVVEIPTRAGDLLIWNSLLPHGTSPNTSDQPRLVQYLSMAPAQEGDEATKQWRIDAWLHRRAPEGDAFPGDPGDWERHHGTTAALTPLGRKLLGLDSWEGDQGEIVQRPYDRMEGRRRGAPGFAS